MIKIIFRRGKIILQGLPGNHVYERESLAFMDEGLDTEGQPLLSIRSVWQDKYVVHKRRISEVVDEQNLPLATTGQPTAQVIEQLNEQAAGGANLPEGGAPGQVLLKSSEQDYDATWSSLPDLKLFFENQLV